MDHMSFKQYLDSKQKLREAIEHTPTSIIEYTVKKYCSIQVGENEKEKSLIGLKPNQRIIVEWRYDNIEEPTITHIMFEGVKNVDETEQFPTFWKTGKLQRWLTRYTKKENKHGH